MNFQHSQWIMYGSSNAETFVVNLEKEFSSYVDFAQFIRCKNRQLIQDIRYDSYLRPYCIQYKIGHLDGFKLRRQERLNDR